MKNVFMEAPSSNGLSVTVPSMVIMVGVTIVGVIVGIVVVAITEH